MTSTDEEVTEGCVEVLVEGGNKWLALQLHRQVRPNVALSARPRANRASLEGSYNHATTDDT